MNFRLRNRLSELLIMALKDGGRAGIIEMLGAYCRGVRACRSTRVRMSRLALTAEAVRSAVSESGILRIEAGAGGPEDPDVDLQSGFWLDADYLCRRVMAYERFLSGGTGAAASRGTLDWAARTGALLFNGALFFECHEFLEGYWREEKGEKKQFLQGIISVATAFYHLERGNTPGALKLLNDCLRRLSGLDRSYGGVAVGSLLRDVERVRDGLGEVGGTAGRPVKGFVPPVIQFG